MIIFGIQCNNELKAADIIISDTKNMSKECYECVTKVEQRNLKLSDR